MNPTTEDLSNLSVDNTQAPVVGFGATNTYQKFGFFVEK